MRRLLAAGVRVAVVGVRVVPMGVGQRLVGVEVVVPRTPGSLLSRLVFVLVVLVVDVPMLMGDQLVGVRVLVDLGQVQPDPKRVSDGLCKGRFPHSKETTL